jgi:MoaA/NifB/PqqE/SkfB family radical SAM enzyme
MDAAFVEKVLNQEVIKRTMIAILSGGEPLLNKDIYNIIRVVKRYKKQCGLITNGLLLSDPLPDLIKAGLDDLQLSVYDHTWDKLQKILPKVCSKFRINASYVLLKSVMEKNPTHVENIVKFCKEAGCSSFKINICQPFDGNDSETIFDDCANYHEFGKKLKLENKNFNLFVPGAIPQILRKPQEKRCLMPWQQILVNGTGEISMCCNTTFLSKPFGNILDDNDNKSYNSPILCEIRRNLLNDNLEVHEFCKKCLHLAGQSYSARL